MSSLSLSLSLSLRESCILLALPLPMRVLSLSLSLSLSLIWFGVGFGHKILAGTSPNVVSDIWSIQLMRAYNQWMDWWMNGWACSIRVHAFWMRNSRCMNWWILLVSTNYHKHWFLFPTFFWGIIIGPKNWDFFFGFIYCKFHNFFSFFGENTLHI